MEECAAKIDANAGAGERDTDIRHVSVPWRFGPETWWDNGVDTIFGTPFGSNRTCGWKQIESIFFTTTRGVLPSISLAIQTQLCGEHSIQYVFYLYSRLTDSQLLPYDLIKANRLIYLIFKKWYEDLYFIGLRRLKAPRSQGVWRQCTRIRKWWKKKFDDSLYCTHLLLSASLLALCSSHLCPLCPCLFTSTSQRLPILWSLVNIL